MPTYNFTVTMTAEVIDFIEKMLEANPKSRKTLAYEEKFAQVVGGVEIMTKGKIDCYLREAHDKDFDYDMALLGIYGAGIYTKTKKQLS